MGVSVIPILRYRKPAAALQWLCDALGFVRHHVVEDNGSVVHAQLKFGDALIFLRSDSVSDRYGMHVPLTLKGTHQYVFLVVGEDEVDRHCARARSHGAAIVTEPYDTSHGEREYSCLDLEGHVWSIGSYRGSVARAHPPVEA